MKIREFSDKVTVLQQISVLSRYYVKLAVVGYRPIIDEIMEANCLSIRPYAIRMRQHPRGIGMVSKLDLCKDIMTKNGGFIKKNGSFVPVLSFCMSGFPV